MGEMTLRGHNSRFDTAVPAGDRILSAVAPNQPNSPCLSEVPLMIVRFRYPLETEFWTSSLDISRGELLYDWLEKLLTVR